MSSLLDTLPDMSRVDSMAQLDGQLGIDSFSSTSFDKTQYLFDLSAHAPSMPEANDRALAVNLFDSSAQWCSHFAFPGTEILSVVKASDDGGRFLMRYSAGTLVPLHTNTAACEFTVLSGRFRVESGPLEGDGANAKRQRETLTAGR